MFQTSLPTALYFLIVAVFYQIVKTALLWEIWTEGNVITWCSAGVVKAFLQANGRYLACHLTNDRLVFFTVKACNVWVWADRLKVSFTDVFIFLSVFSGIKEYYLCLFVWKNVLPLTIFSWLGHQNSACAINVLCICSKAAVRGKPLVSSGTGDEWRSAQLVGGWVCRSCQINPKI